MRVEQFDFELPETAIALRPAVPRDAARLLVVTPHSDRPASLEDRIVRDLPDLLRAGDAFVVNDTKVVPARLSGKRRRGEALAQIDVTLHKRDGAALWRVFARPAKRLAVGETVVFNGSDGDGLTAEVVSREGGEVLLRFDREGGALDDAIERVGRPPLPPYIEARREGDEADRADYQTLFAQRPGAVAAPTASLHFTPDLLTALAKKDIALHRVTLHVGAGTFLPVKSETTDEHVMHAEWGEVTAEVAAALNATRARGGRVVAVGTTSLRILESASAAGASARSIGAGGAGAADGTVKPFVGETSIFITPGYRFRAVDALMTNFHLPRSTLFMLVSAFSGLSTMRAAYAHAVRSGYRFYSYGDGSLLWRLDDPTRAAT